MLRIARDFWHSMVRQGWPRSAKERTLAIINNLFLHIHPAFVRGHSLRATYTFGLGVIAVVLLILLVLTGVLLMLYYSPHPDTAYRSMKDLEFAVPFGGLIRNLHRWSSHGLIVVVFLHMLRVFFTGGHKGPRSFNWVIGVVLFLLTLLIAFTGYLLPWDQLAYWATTVGSAIASYVPVIGDELRYLLLGGNEVGAGALLRFYVLHCAVLPGIIFGFLAVHIWRVRKDGGLSAPAPAAPAAPANHDPPGRPFALKTLVRGAAPPCDEAPEDLVPAWPALLLRELLVALAVIAAFMLISFVLDAPLEERADPTLTPNPAKAPWFFLALQELAHYSALFGGVVAPTLAVALLLLLPYLETRSGGVGCWFHRSRRVWCAGFALLALGYVALTVLGAFFRGPNWSLVWPW